MALIGGEIGSALLKGLVRVLIYAIRVPAFMGALILLVGTVCLVGGVTLGQEALAFLTSDRSLTRFVSKLWSG